MPRIVGSVDGGVVSSIVGNVDERSSVQTSMIFSFGTTAVDGDVLRVGEVVSVEGVDVVGLGGVVADAGELVGVLVVEDEQPASAMAMTTVIPPSARRERFSTSGD